MRCWAFSSENFTRAARKNETATPFQGACRYFTEAFSLSIRLRRTACLAKSKKQSNVRHSAYIRGFSEKTSNLRFKLLGKLRYLKVFNPVLRLFKPLIYLPHAGSMGQRANCGKIPQRGWRFDGVIPRLARPAPVGKDSDTALPLESAPVPRLIYFDFQDFRIGGSGVLLPWAAVFEFYFAFAL